MTATGAQAPCRAKSDREGPPGPCSALALGALGKSHTHQSALRAALPGFDHELQQVDIQDADII